MRREMALFSLRRSTRAIVLLAITVVALFGLVSDNWLARMQNGFRHHVYRKKYDYLKGSLSKYVRPGESISSPEDVPDSTTKAAESGSRSRVPANMSLETYERLVSTRQDQSHPDITEPITCDNLHRPIMITENGSSVRMKPKIPDEWQTIRGNGSFVFSAHRDPRYADRIRIRVLGTMKMEVMRDAIQGRLFCQIWNTTRFIAVVPGTVRALGLKNIYASFMLICDFPSYTAPLNRSYYVAVTKFPCLRPMNALHVNDNSYVISPYHKFSVCLTTVIGGDFNDHKRFIEWMELTAVLGSKKAIVYGSEVSSNTKKVLTYYNRKGLLNIVNWKPPSGADEMDEAAHTVLINDCLYRNLRKTVYLAVLDVYETLAPIRPHLYTWDELMRCACCVNNSYVAAMTANFDPRQENNARYRESEFISTKTRLLTLLKTDRSERLLPADVGSKGLMKTSMIDSLGVGRVEFVFNIYLEPCVVPECIALIYTYHEVDDVNGDQQGASARISDSRLHKYSSLLTTSVSIVHRELQRDMNYLVV